MFRREELRAGTSQRVLPLLAGDPGLEVRPLICVRLQQPGASRCALLAATLPHHASLTRVTSGGALTTLACLTSPPAAQVIDELPPLGTALPVVIPKARNPGVLPKAGEWVKVKVAGLQLHEVREGQ